MPFAIKAVVCEQDNLFCDLPNVEGLGYFNHACHRQSATHTVICGRSHGFSIMCQKDAVFLGSPPKDCGVVCSR